MKKIILIFSLLYLFHSCDFENHSHDGRYFGKLQMLGIGIADVDVFIEGNTYYVRNSLMNIDTKLKCKQFKDKIEVNENGSVVILYVLPNGDLKLNDNFILKKINGIDNSRANKNFSDDEDIKENNKNALNNDITSSTIGNNNSEDINNKDSFEESRTTTKCRVYKKETWIYSKNSFTNNEESKRYRIYKLTEGERVDVIMNWNEFPEDMVKVIYYNKNGDKIIGFMVTSSLQFLEAG